MRFVSIFRVVPALLFMGSVFLCPAQTPSAADGSFSLFPRGDLVCLFGGHRNFSATMLAEIAPESERQEPRRMEMDFALLQGAIRVEVKTSQILDDQGVLGSEDSLKRLGMERQVNLIRPEDQKIYLLYPGLEGYIEVPFPRSERGVMPERIHVKKQKVGEETLNGHPCVKNEVELIHPNGEERTALVWEATDLVQFPIRIALEHRGSTLQLDYREIDFSQPDEALFRVPPAYRQYEDLKALTRVAIQKLYGDNALQELLPEQ